MGGSPGTQGQVPSSCTRLCWGGEHKASYVCEAAAGRPGSQPSCVRGCRPQPGALGAWCTPCGAESRRPSNRWRSRVLALPCPLTERALLEPLAVGKPPAPKPSPRTPGSSVQRQARSGAEAWKEQVASPSLAQPAPSWAASLAARQVWARLGQGRAASRQQLCHIGPLSRAGVLQSWRRTPLQPSRA